MFITGDFNYDLLKSAKNENIKLFTEIMYGNMFQPFIIYPTRIVKNAKPSLLDNIFSNLVDNELISGNLIEKISDHLPNFIIIPHLNKSDFKHHYQKRDYSKFDEIFFINDLQNESLVNKIHESDDTNSKYDIFTNSITTIIDKHAPLKNITKNDLDLKIKPWLTKGILKSIKKRTMYYKKYLSSRNNKWYDLYKLYKDKLKQLIRFSKTNYYKNYFTTHTANIKKIWVGINNLLSKKKNKQSNINLYEKEEFTTDQTTVANKFNSYFTNIGPMLSSKIATSDKHFSEFLPPNTNESFFLYPTNPEEITIELNALSESTASDIPVRLIKVAINPISEMLSHIFNHSFENGIFPEKLKFGIVIPAHKGDSKLSLNNYRPISLLPIFSKILERLVHKRLMNFLTKHNTLFEHQFGFQPNKTTSMAILDIYTKIVSALENKEIACCIFLDFAKAFDTVNHNILLQKLENYGIRGLPLKWFTSYLHKRHQVVKLCNIYSDKLEIKCGVPQGSVLGPLLFLIYINDIYRTSNILKFHLFADDTSIFFSNKDVHTIKSVVNKELCSVSHWLSANKLSLNVSKSSFILFHPPQKKVTKITLQIYNEDIPEKASTKYLGVNIDKHITWKEHINYLLSKLTRAIAILTKIRYNVPKYLLRTLFFTFYKPYIDYCINIWTCTSQTNLDLINVSMKKAIRVITFSKFDAHSDPLFKSLNLLNLEKTIEFNLGKFMWNVQNNKLPIFLAKEFKMEITTQSSRKIIISKNYTPLSRTKYKEYFVTTKGPLLWRKIPTYLRDIRSKNIFSKKYSKLLLGM